jgi:hypothetical protein
MNILLFPSQIPGHDKAKIRATCVLSVNTSVSHGAFHLEPVLEMLCTLLFTDLRVSNFLKDFLVSRMPAPGKRIETGSLIM